MLVEFKGVKGSGMTLGAVILTWEEFKKTGKLVFFDYNLGHYKYLDKKTFIKERERPTRIRS